jgi:hypothetical protein
MTGRVVRFPVDWRQRWRNRMGDRAVPCQVSGRWLEFPEAADRVAGEDWMVINVMTEDYAGEKARKLCGLVLSRDDLLHALNRVALPPSDPE